MRTLFAVLIFFALSVVAAFASKDEGDFPLTIHVTAVHMEQGRAGVYGGGSTDSNGNYSSSVSGGGSYTWQLFTVQIEGDKKTYELSTPRMHYKGSKGLAVATMGWSAVATARRNYLLSIGDYHGRWNKDGTLEVQFTDPKEQLVHQTFYVQAEEIAPIPTPTPAPAQEGGSATSNPTATSIEPALLSQALSGDANAEFTLGSKYAAGQGVPKDYALAAVWDRKAAEQGNVGAELALGAIYFMGEGVPRDYAQASLWWDKAAEQDDATAHYALGMMYANGQGVPQNFAEAYYRYALAAQGSVVNVKPEQVASDRDAAAAHLSPSELTSTRERVRQWLASHGGQAAAQ